MITREVYVVDVSTPDATHTLPRFIDERHAHRQIDDLLRAAPKGSHVRLVVGRVSPPFSTAEMMRPAPFWIEMVRDHIVQIEGEVRTVRAWKAALEGVGS